MFDGETLIRHGHSAGCVTLLDGTVVVSVFGGFTTNSWSSVVSNPTKHIVTRKIQVVRGLIKIICLPTSLAVYL